MAWTGPKQAGFTVFLITEIPLTDHGPVKMQGPAQRTQRLPAEQAAYYIQPFFKIVMSVHNYTPKVLCPTFGVHFTERGAVFPASFATLSWDMDRLLASFTDDSCISGSGRECPRSVPARAAWGFRCNPTVSFPQQFFRIQIGIIEEKIVKVIHPTTEREAIFTHFLVVGEHDAIIVFAVSPKL